MLSEAAIKAGKSPAEPQRSVTEPVSVTSKDPSIVQILKRLYMYGF